MDSRAKTFDKLFWFVTAILFVIGIIGVSNRLINGHRATNYGSYIPWGLWIASYIWLIGLSAGAFLMSTMTYVFKVKSVQSVGKLALLLAIATLAGAMLSVWFDLGHMWRAWRLILHTHLTSMMGWMAVLYGSYIVLLIIELFIAIKMDLVNSTDTKKTLKTVLTILGSIGIPLAFAFHGGVGGVFAAISSRAYWHSPLTPVYFLAGAFLSGGALFAFIAAIYAPNKQSPEFIEMMSFIGKVVLGFLVLDTIFEISEIYVGLFTATPDETPVLMAILSGHYWYAFWIVHVLFGIVIPAYLLIAKPRSVTAIAVAGLLIAITFLAVRLNIVIPGLILPEINGLSHAFVNSRLTYHYIPSAMEWEVELFIVSIAMAIFMIGKAVLPILSNENLPKEEAVKIKKQMAEA